MPRINDAVMRRRDGDYVVIVRVIAVTPDGRAVCEYNGEFVCERKSGDWPVIGRFEKRNRWRGWEFIAEEGNRAEQ